MVLRCKNNKQTKAQMHMRVNVKANFTELLHKKNVAVIQKHTEFRSKSGEMHSLMKQVSQHNEVDFFFFMFNVKTVIS